MTALAPAPIRRVFTLNGSIEPLMKAVAGPQGHKPTRPLGGWLMVYALLGPNGGLHPVLDRENQVMEAASELGRIDWTEYLRKGRWNDTHNENVLVGQGTNLEFHDQHTPLAKAHGKVGFWTSGHLWDPADASSWELYTDHVPNPTELRRADEFWTLAQCLKGTPRPLGLSAHGWMELSACKSRILTAGCEAAAVCELPMNPASTVEPMELALRGSPLEWLRKGMVARHDRPCRTCSCPPGAACLALRKGLQRADSAPLMTDRLDIESDDTAVLTKLDRDDPAAKVEALIALIQARFFVTRADAVRWVARYLNSEGASR
jgi:hypothetical protein